MKRKIMGGAQAPAKKKALSGNMAEDKAKRGGIKANVVVMPVVKVTKQKK